MDDGHLTRRCLESLTTRELAALADNLGVDIPPDLDRSFIIEELLEAQRDEDDLESQELGEQAPRDFAPQGQAPLGEAVYLEPAPLPKQYNITYIKVLVRDPLWVFTFWEIKGQDKEVYEKDPDFEGYFLRVSPGGGDSGTGPGKQAAGSSFTVPVGVDDTAWYLGFPPDYAGKDAAGGGWYQVELCVQGEAEQAVLAVSRPFKLPALLLPADMKAARSPLADLSAIDELPVLRNGDRQSRLPRSLR